MNLLTRSAALLLAGACATMLVSPLAEADNTPIVSSPSDRLSEVQAEWTRINYQLSAA